MRDLPPPVSTPVDYSCGCGQPAGGGINPNCGRWIYRSESTTQVPPLTANRYQRLILELPYRNCEFVDDSLQQARLVMVWRVPGLNQLDQTYELDVWGGGVWSCTSRLVRELREERSLVSSNFSSNMTQRLQGRFIFQSSYQWKIWETGGSRDRATHTLSRQNWLQR